MATQSSVLAWRILWTEGLGGLPSIGSHGVGHDGTDLAAAAAAVTNSHKLFSFMDFVFLVLNVNLSVISDSL